MTLVIACGRQYLGQHGWVDSTAAALQFETEAQARMWPPARLVAGREWTVRKIDAPEPVLAGDAIRHDWNPFGGQG